MNVKRLWILVVALSLAASLLGFSALAQRRQPSTIVWEYKIIYRADEQGLNELGVQGWEVTGVAAFSNGSAQQLQIYLKRAK